MRHLKRIASRDAALIRQRDGAVKAFDRMTVAKELSVARQTGRGGTFLEFADDPDLEPGEVEGLSE